MLSSFIFRSEKHNSKVFLPQITPPEVRQSWELCPHSPGSGIRYVLRALFSKVIDRYMLVAFYLKTFRYFRQVDKITGKQSSHHSFLIFTSIFYLEGPPCQSPLNRERYHMYLREIGSSCLALQEIVERQYVS